MRSDEIAWARTQKPRRSGVSGVAPDSFGPLSGAPSAIRRLVLRQASVLIGIGLALGVLVGLSLATLFAAHLHRMAAADLATWSLTALLIAALGLLACWLPAQRATRVAPRVALEAASQA